MEKKLTAETDKKNPETNIRKTSLGNTLTLAHKHKLNLHNSLPVLNYRRKGITIFIPLRNKIHKYIKRVKKKEPGLFFFPKRDTFMNTTKRLHNNGQDIQLSITLSM